MPEGDTLARTAAGLRPYLVGREVRGRGRARPGPQVDRLVGSTVTGVEAMGKNLLIRFDNGLEVRTHLRMRGSWHRYRPGEAWRRPPGRGRRSCSRCRDRSPCASTPRWSSCSSSGPRRSTRRCRSWVRTCSPTRSTSTRRCAACATPERADLTDRRGAARPAGARRHRQRGQEPGPVGGRALPVDAGSGTSTTPRCAGSWTGAPSVLRDRRRDGPPAAGVPRPGRAPVPAMRDDRAGEGARPRAAAPDLLVPALPAGAEERPA